MCREVLLDLSLDGSGIGWECLPWEDSFGLREGLEVGGWGGRRSCEIGRSCGIGQVIYVMGRQ